MYDSMIWSNKNLFENLPLILKIIIRHVKICNSFIVLYDMMYDMMINDYK